MKADNSSNFRVEDQQMILAAHKCNEMKKLSDAIEYGIESFEVDVHISMENGMPVLMIGHEAETYTGQSFEEYVEDLMSMKTDFKFLWLDFKDLNSDENEVFIKEILIKIDAKYSIKHRVLVESRYIQYLTVFVNEGWTVSYYCNWSSLQGQTSEQQNIICADWLKEMQENNVNGISFDAAVYTIIRDNFENKTVNDRIVKQYSWNYNIEYTTPNLEEQLQKYSHLSVLLISFPLKFEKYFILDVEFAENGIATNMGETINSLPSQQGIVNKIETQYNDTYGKYEAIFDGTNFFFIPYLKEGCVLFNSRQRTEEDTS
jgi:hypothetical protein